MKNMKRKDVHTLHPHVHMGLSEQALLLNFCQVFVSVASLDIKLYSPGNEKRLSRWYNTVWDEGLRTRCAFMRQVLKTFCLILLSSAYTLYTICVYVNMYVNIYICIRSFTSLKRGIYVKRGLLQPGNDSHEILRVTGHHATQDRCTASRNPSHYFNLRLVRLCHHCEQTKHHVSILHWNLQTLLFCRITNVIAAGINHGMGK